MDVIWDLPVKATSQNKETVSCTIALLTLLQHSPSEVSEYMERKVCNRNSCLCRFFSVTLKAVSKELKKEGKSEYEKRFLFTQNVSNGAWSPVQPLPEFYTQQQMLAFRMKQWGQIKKKSVLELVAINKTYSSDHHSGVVIRMSWILM